MNSYLYLRIKDKSLNYVVYKMHEINVTLYEITENNNSIYFKIKEEDYSKIRKNLPFLEVKKIKYTGKTYFNMTLKKYRIIYFFMAISFLIVLASSFFIVDIRVIHEDDKLCDLIISELEKRGVKRFSFKKSFDTLEKIKKDIKNDNTDLIDWLEIEKRGMNYVVRVEKRIQSKQKIDDKYCNVYALKDGLISNILMVSGESKVSLNDYVHKGDLLISGDITLNEEKVSSVCADGKVFAQMWYKVAVSVPFEYEKEIKTGKKRNNLIVNYDDVDYQVFKDRLKYYTYTKKLLFDAFGIKFYQKIDEEIKKEKNKYTVDEALKIAMENAKEKVSLSLLEDDKILSQKVLQKTVNDSTIDIVMFIVTEENIALKKAEEESDKNDI